jgi:hypothetical protein
MDPTTPTGGFFRGGGRRGETSGVSASVRRARRRRLGLILLAIMAVLPWLYVIGRTADARRNIVYWDEFDTALTLILKLKEGLPAEGLIGELFKLSNEHRMVTSRLLYVASYWLTGTIDFAVIGAIGNATVLVLCLLLLATAGTTLRRVRLAVLLAYLLFQLEHYENYLWSGASIDHCQVVMLAAAAIVGLARGTRGGLIAGGAFATLATLTLAHGMAVWPVGAAMLWHARRRRALAAWGLFALFAVGGFFTGFKLNTAQVFVTVSFDGAWKVLHYWLSLLGAAPATGSPVFSAPAGAGLLALIGYGAIRGGLRREAIALPLAVFAITAAGMIAVGRAAESGGEIFSRYYVLSALAWALALFIVFERHTHPRRPLQVIGSALPALIMFNIGANREFSDETDSWLECRDRAVTAYNHYRVDGRGTFSLHPLPAHSTALLEKAERLGVYRLGPVCLPEPFPAKAREVSRMHYFVDDFDVTADSASLRGWVAIPGRRSRRGSIHIVLRAGREHHLFTAVAVSRPDVAMQNKRQDWKESGFHFAKRFDRLPTGDFQVGFLIEDGPRVEYMMTAHRLLLDGPRSKALLATGK